MVSAGITYEFGLFDCQSSDLAWMLENYDEKLHSSGYSGTKVAVKLNFDQCEALCTSRPSCTGFRMHTKPHLPGDDMKLGCEIFQGNVRAAHGGSIGRRLQPCPPTNPQLHEFNSESNDYWCYTVYDASPCRMDKSGYPPPTGSVWGSNQAHCPLWHTWKKSFAGTHVCSLYDKTPTPLSTASARRQTRSRPQRAVGFIERDFSDKIAFFDDGEHPACDCYEGSTAYNCKCSDESLEPYQGIASDAMYGCAGHGRCASLEYKCICHDGHGWLWGDRDASSDNVGYTCRECPEGTFKDATVSTYALPAGKVSGRGWGIAVQGGDIGTSSVLAGSKHQSDCHLLPRVPCYAGTFALSTGDCENCPQGSFQTHATLKSVPYARLDSLAVKRHPPATLAHRASFRPATCAQTVRRDFLRTVRRAKALAQDAMRRSRKFQVRGQRSARCAPNRFTSGRLRVTCAWKAESTSEGLATSATM